MGTGIFDLAVVITVAAVLSIVIKMLKQPLVVAYLLTGIIIAWFGYFHLGEHEVFKVFSEMGIMFLLFLVGLEINYSSLRLVGKATLLVGFGQIIFTFASAFGLACLFGFGYLPAFYLGSAFTFSSTIIVVKLLGDRQDLNSFYGKISIGVLLAQDVVAILLLIVLAGVESGTSVTVADFAFTLGVNALLFLAIIILSRFVFPKLFGKIARSQEMVFLLSLAWVFLMAAFVTKIGLSIEIAGFLAGLALANSSEHFQIAGYIRPLKDFFILIFFVILGSSFVFSGAGELWLPVLVFSLFVLLVKPFIIMSIMGLIGHRRRTGFLSATVLAQVSEFSLIIIAFGLRLGHIDNSVVSTVTMVAIITIVMSSYMSIYAEKFYLKVNKYLRFFERKKVAKENTIEEIPKRPIVLIGYHRTGKSIMNNLDKDQVLVIDFDPEVINQSKHLGMAHILGDITDPEILELAHIRQCKLIICTSADIEDSLRVINYIKDLKRKPKFVARAATQVEAKTLYSAGATYVLLPLFSVGDYLGKVLMMPSWGKTLKELKKRDIDLIKKIDMIV